MARRQITTCDKCGEEVEHNEGGVWVVTDRRVDAAGSMDDEWEYIDLCTNCLIVELQELLCKTTVTERRGWIDRVLSI